MEKNQAVSNIKDESRAPENTISTASPSSSAEGDREHKETNARGDER